VAAAADAEDTAPARSAAPVRTAPAVAPAAPALAPQPVDAAPLPVPPPAPTTPFPLPAPAPAAPVASGAPAGCGAQGVGHGGTLAGGFCTAVLPAMPADLVLALGAGRTSLAVGSIGGPVADTGARPD
jgi:hypothetical protein